MVARGRGKEAAPCQILRRDIPRPLQVQGSAFDVRCSVFSPNRKALGFLPVPLILCLGKWLSNPNRCSIRKSCASRRGYSRIIVTSMRETRLYYKGARQQTYERFETVRLAADEALLKRFVFLLGAERVVSEQRESHLYDLLRASETVGRALTNQFYGLYADIRQRVLSRLCRENSTTAPSEILRCTQKLLDRVLFCAFCEDRGLLPAESLKHAFEHRDPYNPHPLWHNFRGLFRAIDEGNAGLNIPAYNGGLFALDPALDTLQVPDEVCAHFKDLGDYDYRPVSVM
jgi:hypothetical protein